MERILVLCAAMICGSLATLIPRIMDLSSCNQQCGNIDTLHAPVYGGLVVFLASSLGLFVEIRLAYTRDTTTISSSSSRTTHKGDNNDNQNAEHDKNNDSSRSNSIVTAIDPNDTSHTVLSSSSITKSPHQLKHTLQTEIPKLVALAPKLILPAFLNVSGTVCQLMALLYLPAAVLAGMRGVLILITAINSSLLKLSDAPKGKKEWIYIFVSALGAVAVGGAAAAISSSSNNAGGDENDANTSNSVQDIGIGLSLCAGGYFLASLQVALEAKTLDSGISKWAILGVEGLFGLLILIPLLGILQAVAAASSTTSNDSSNYSVLVEIPSHTLCCLQANPGPTIGLSVGYGLSSFTFNALLLTLSAMLGANMRVFIFTARGCLTWGIETLLYYTSPYPQFGSPLSGNQHWWWSVLELLGFIFLITAGLARAQLQASRTAAATAATTVVSSISSSKSATRIISINNAEGDEQGEDDLKTTLLGAK